MQSVSLIGLCIVASFIAVIIMAAAGVLLWARSRAPGVRGAGLASFAQARGLAHSWGADGGEQADGMWRAMEARVKVLADHAGGARTVVGLRPPFELPAGLAIAPQEQRAAFIGVFGGQDVVIGDARLDETFQIKGHDVEAVREFLGYPFRIDALLRLRERYPTIYMDAAGLAVQIPAYASERELGEVLDALHDAMMAMAPGTAWYASAAFEFGTSMEDASRAAEQDIMLRRGDRHG
jgi:hypothetical protein